MDQPSASFIPAADKICDKSRLMQRAAQWRAHGETLVFTNGCFDLLHVGHVMSLEYARRAGDRLIVGLNGDQSVQRLKGLARPVVTENERAFILAALGCVDAVIVFAEDTPLSILEWLKPDVLVKGGDYREEQVVGREIVQAYGGRILIAPFIPNRSTTSLITRLNRGDRPE